MKKIYEKIETMLNFDVPFALMTIFWLIDVKGENE
jgi:hypothetical protein